MPVYKYIFGVYIGSKKITSLPLYVEESKRDHDQALFRDIVNGCGDCSQALHNALMKKISSLSETLAQICDSAPEIWKDLLDYSFPVELWSSDILDEQPDYTFISSYDDGEDE